MTTKNKKPNIFNAANERVKYKYRQHIRRVGQKDEKTVLAALKHIREFEIFVDFKGFECFDSHLADKYIQSMLGKDLSLSYVTDNIRSLRDFLNWLERQRGYRSKIDSNHIEYLNLTNNQRRTAKAPQYQKAYSYDQIIAAIRQMPSKTDCEKRDKAVISLQALCTLRVSELRTVKLKSLIEEDGEHFIYVCPKDMQTKFAKTRSAVFVSLPDDIKANVLDWRDYLVTLGFSERDPLFPVIYNGFNQRNLLEAKVKKSGIKSDTTIRHIFKNCFENAGCKYLNPHSFRKTLARYAQKKSPEFLNAVRQNLGHSSIDTTLNSYGHLSDYDQRRAIADVEFHS